jgi:phage shock protein A
MGITQEMLDTAQACGFALQQSFEGLRATEESLRTQQSLARNYDREAETLYDKAKEAMKAGEEESARDLLMKRTDCQDRFKKVLMQCAEEKKRLQTMEKNVETIERRALEVESLMQRTVGSKARQDSLSNADVDFSMSAEDPLLKKFRDAGID